VDWMGDTPECVLDSETGKLTKAHFFVAMLGIRGIQWLPQAQGERQSHMASY